MESERHTAPDPGRVGRLSPHVEYSDPAVSAGADCTPRGLAGWYPEPGEVDCSVSTLASGRRPRGNYPAPMARRRIPLCSHLRRSRSQCDFNVRPDADRPERSWTDVDGFPYTPLCCAAGRRGRLQAAKSRLCGRSIEARQPRQFGTQEGSSRQRRARCCGEVSSGGIATCAAVVYVQRSVRELRPSRDWKVVEGCRIRSRLQGTRRSPSISRSFRNRSSKPTR